MVDRAAGVADPPATTALIKIEKRKTICQIRILNLSCMILQ